MVGCAAMSSTVSLVALLKKVEHPKGLQVVDDVAKPVAIEPHGKSVAGSGGDYHSKNSNNSGILHTEG